MAGRLPPGTRLPTHRDLAWRLKVTVGTITRAYQEAERQGLIGGEVGRGTFVRDPQRGLDTPLDMIGGSLIDLSINSPALRPDAPVLRDAMIAAAARPDLPEIAGYQASLCPASLRTAGRAWISEMAALTVPEDQILLTAGGQGAIHAALAAVTRPGDTVLVEQLGYPGLRPLAAQLGLRLFPVPMDGHGLLPDAVEHLARAHGAHTLYTMPTLQNPTTATLPLERRTALVDIARRTGITLVEDDVHGFLAPRCLPTLAELGPDVTIYLTSLSKSLFPGLRTGFAVPPRLLLDRMAAVLRATLLTPIHLGVIVAAELITSGNAVRIAAQRRELVKERQALARDILGPGSLLSDPAASHLWLHLPEPWQREDFVQQTLLRGVRVTPADVFTVARAEAPQAVRVCLGAVERRDILEKGLGILAELLAGPVAATAPALV